MYHERIESPKSGRQCAVRVWAINPKEMHDRLGSDFFRARELSWALLEEGATEMAAEMDGDSAPRNFALSIFENALDWRLGTTVLGVLKAYQKRRPGLVPRHLFVAVNRAGNVFYRVGPNNPWRNGSGNGS